MKKVTLFFLVILTTCFKLVGQTEEETLSFLNTKLAAHATPLVNTRVDYKVSTYFNPVLKKYAINLKVYLDKELGQSLQFYPESITDVVTDRAPNGNLGIKIICPQGLIESRFPLQTKKSLKSKHFIPLQTTDDEVERIQKGFIHLFKLFNAPIVNQDIFRN